MKINRPRYISINPFLVSVTVFLYILDTIRVITLIHYNLTKSWPFNESKDSMKNAKHTNLREFNEQSSLTFHLKSEF